MLTEYVNKRIALELEWFPRVKTHYAFGGWAIIGIEPAVQNAISASDMQFAYFMFGKIRMDNFLISPSVAAIDAIYHSLCQPIDTGCFQNACCRRFRHRKIPWRALRD
jgi:hypothetical protein